ncbi:tripartite tricarboxylate transporter substrate binding protein [Bordetella sp. BOR01]|uniref:Bug family tripartite tricarboxylate transporter substrate binding protein n=1 Tax=Bordetella sp. BOR01 TaxID=2854779 RepID=UPI001C47225B|nr:tripartite tricarboxylate transporter substrate binding protein [Bordetella sp. BOR01]MBV7484558.1 tripartite tricarboxylate transporter substrate binding protein [Bordetella sp. BOR01]
MLALLHPLHRTAAMTLALACLATGAPAARAASDFPTRSITMVVPYPPGGPTDTVSRLVAAEMSKTIGQNVVVENKPGASGMIGADLVARAKPDGYTFLANASLHVINPYLYKSMRYDSFKDFAPITQLADVPLVLVVPESSSVRTVQDLVKLGKTRPLNFGSAGTASAQQLAGESFKVRSGLAMQHVPYKGSAPALTDLVGGQIQLMFDSMPSAMPFIKSGKLRAVAVTTPQRVDELANIPTMAESGFPGFDISTWYGLWAPAGTPPEIVAKLSQHAARALKQPGLVSQYASLGAKPVGSDPQTFARFTESEGKKWRDIVTAAQIQPQ